MNMKFRLWCLLVGLATAVSLCCLGCAGGNTDISSNSQLLPPDNQEPLPAAQHVFRTVDVETVLAQLAEAETPSGIEPDTFELLKDELARVLLECYGGNADSQLDAKLASVLQPEQLSQAWCLQGRFQGESSAMLLWRGRHAGDYDLNGEVNIADLTPLGMLFGSSVVLDADGLPEQQGKNEWARQVDGDTNGEVNIADVTPIGVNFQSRHSGYRVYLGKALEGQPIDWETEYQPNADNPALPVTLPFNRSTASGTVNQYELQFELPILFPDEILHARVVPFDGSAEGPEAVIAFHPGPHSTLKCDLCHNVTDYSFRGMSGLCDMCHSTPPEDSASDWAAVPGMHGQCLMCHDSHGFAISPPESVCNRCHTDKPSSEHYGGQTECLSCHQQAHLPVSDPASGSCMDCHDHPPENSQFTWDMAPGLHGSCLTCHPGDHPDRPVPAESICGQCHADIVATATPAKKLECLICHEFAHVPNAHPQPETCQTCHSVQYDEFQQNKMTTCFGCHKQHDFKITDEPALCRNCHVNPPEDSTADWDAAPGLHNQCSSCHERHSFVINEPNSVCANCHQSQIDAGHASGQTDCLSCHDSPHLPVTGSGTCESCHTTPPEDANASWTDAPGLHADCLQCHPGDHPDRPVPPESVCSNCHTDKPNPDHGGGLSTCLDCHQFAHLPVTDLAELDCQSCHPTPPEDNLAQWIDAPGQHAQCLSCHAGPQHGNKPVPPESICSSCHTDKPNPNHGGGLSTCLDCHFFPHLPNTDIRLLNCKGCHPVPPERPNKEWGDAPGDHDKCFQCHTESWHGFAPDPTREFCNMCHEEDHGGSNACIQCHLYEHVPVKP